MQVDELAGSSYIDTLMCHGGALRLDWVRFVRGFAQIKPWGIERRDRMTNCMPDDDELCSYPLVINND